MSFPARILTVIVLYRLKHSESVAFRSFCDALRMSPGLRDVFRLQVFDNSPEAQKIDSEYVEKYVHDVSNPGLAKPYNLALRAASEADIPWLMLFDQDTFVTLPYLQEAVRLIQEQKEHPNIVALVPKLVEEKSVSSPHTLLGFRGILPVSVRASGLATQELHAFNSGAVLRVAALEAIGGFPQHYPLDFLDHATFRMLQRQGKRLYLMESCLEHKLSLVELVRDKSQNIPPRLRHIFTAEVRFYTEMGTPMEKFLHHVRLLYFAAKSLWAGSYHRSLMFLKLAIGQDA